MKTNFISRWLQRVAVVSLGAMGSVAAQAQAVVAAEAVKPAANPYGLGALLSEGDFVSKGTLLILLMMSAATWYVGIMKFMEQRRLLQDARQLAQAGNVSEKIAAVGKDSVFRDLGVSGAQAVEQVRNNPRLDADSWVGNAIGDAIDRINGYLQGGMSVLATVGSTGPFVGLFGTVWGIYHALTAIGAAGQASIDKVAGPVGEALIMTAIGLAVAVPAVLGYNWLLRRNKLIVEQARLRGGQLHQELVLALKQ